MLDSRSFLAKANQARENGNFLESLKFTDEAIVLAQSEENLLNLSEGMSTRVLAFRLLAGRTGDKVFLVNAKHDAECAVEIAKRSGDKTALAVPIHNLAKVQVDLGEIAEGAKNFGLALEALITNPPAPHDRPGVRADFKCHYVIYSYMAGDESFADKIDEAIKELEASGEDKISDYNYKVWLSGAHMHAAEAFNAKNKGKAKTHLEMAKKIIVSDERLAIRKGQLDELSKKLG